MDKKQKRFSESTRRFYNKMGAWHEELRSKGTVDSEILPRLFALVPKDLSRKSVLDAGGGGGAFSQLAADRGSKKIVLIDISEKMLTLAKKRKRDRKLSRLFIQKADLVESGLRRESFNIIFSIYSLPYITNLDAAFKEFNRLLKKKGKLYLASDYYQFKKTGLGGTQIQYALDKVKMTAIAHTKKNYLDAAKKNGFIANKWFAVIQAHGLEIAPGYKYKKSTKQHTFGAVFTKK